MVRKGSKIIAALGLVGIWTASFLTLPWGGALLLVGVQAGAIGIGAWKRE